MSQLFASGGQRTQVSASAMPGQAYGSLEVFQFFALIHVKETMKRGDWVVSVLTSILKNLLVSQDFRADLNVLFSEYKELEPTLRKSRFLRHDHRQSVPPQAMPPTRFSSVPERLSTVLQQTLKNGEMQSPPCVQTLQAGITLRSVGCYSGERTSLCWEGSCLSLCRPTSTCWL